MEAIRQALQRDAVLLDVEVEDVSQLFDACLNAACESDLLEREQIGHVKKALLNAERAAPTAIGAGVSVPHAYLEELPRAGVVFARLARPLPLGGPDGVATRFVFLMLGPTRDAIRHLDTLAAIARLMSDARFRYDATYAPDVEALRAALEAFEARHTDHEQAVTPRGLEPVRGLFAGAKQDLRRRLAVYRDDLRDGLHIKTLSATAFMLFACLAPAITFGGVMGTYTGGQIGGAEMLVAVAVCGTLFAFIGGQPLIILGGTGPLLVLTALLYQQCESHGLPFLPMYAWTGLWAGLLVMLLAIGNVARLMRHFTRFSTDIFAALVAAIFIVEAIKPLWKPFRDPAFDHDTALLALLLGVGTFQVARALGRIRSTHYFSNSVREFLGDFGAVIALGVMTWVALELHEVALPRLQVPDHFGTTSGRGWLVPLWELPWWARFAALVPASLVALLVFLNQNITARVVNSPDHGLQRGPAYHWDLFVVGGLLATCSMFGLPWLVGAMVRSLNHVLSLSTVDQGRVVHVRETRLTPILVHVLIACALFVLPLLKVVPMAVLYGLFLLMGANSLSGNQLWDRVQLWVTDRDYRPVTHYTRHATSHAIHVYTLVQVACLGLLWLVKVSKLGIFFPLFIAALVPVRWLLERFFSAEHLAALDADRVPRPRMPERESVPRYPSAAAETK